MQLQLTDGDRRMFAALRISTDGLAEPIPFDAAAAAAMIEQHRQNESVLRSEISAVIAENAGRIDLERRRAARWRRLAMISVPGFAVLLVAMVAIIVGRL